MGQRSTAEPWIGSVNGLSVEEDTMEGLNGGISRVLIWNEGPRWRGTRDGGRDAPNDLGYERG